MSDHTPEHEQFLEALASGEIDFASESTRARLQQCDTCAGTWRELEATAAQLERLARQTRAALAPRRESEALESRALEMLERAREGTRSARRPRLAWPWLALAAAITCLALLWARPFGRGAQVDDPLLGDEAVRVEVPAGAIEAREGLRIVYDLPAGARFSIVLTGTLADGSPFRAVESTSLSSWQPNAQLLGRLPDVVQVQVAAIDALGETLAVSSPQSFSVSR